VDKSVDAVDNSHLKAGKSSVVGIFAKQPIAGKCKTRLSPPLSLEEAADLYLCSLRETVARLQRGSDYDLVICYTGARSWFEQTFPGIPLLPQQGADLGLRMAAALKGFLRQGYRQAVLVGSDAPDLPLELVGQAFSALQQAEVVIAPATDGGYVLIGEAKHHPQLFERIEWSTPEVFAETLRRIERQAIPAVTLESWEDLDDLGSLQRFLLRSPASKTAAYLRLHLDEQLSTGD
jgi:rSAM/selenodomain-associated transferase 1